MKDALTRTCPFVALLLLAACGGAQRERVVVADRPVDEETGEQVLAVVGGEEITEAEVAGVVAAELINARRARHEALQRGLEQLASQRLVELEAKARGISGPELEQQEVAAKAGEPTAADVDAFYEQNRERIRQPKEHVEGQIRAFLMQQRLQQARQELLDQLKILHGYASYLEPFRVPVEADGFPALGPAEAPVTIVEFSDFECPFCGRVVPTLEEVRKNYGEKVRLVFRQFPLNNIHPNAQKAAEASLCAHDQQKFWPMHDAMFKEQRSLGVEQLKEKAARLGLEAGAFNECLDSGRHADQVAADLEAGGSLGVTGTPALFINGRFLSGAQPYDEIARLIDEELAVAGSAG